MEEKATNGLFWTFCETSIRVLRGTNLPANGFPESQSVRVSDICYNVNSLLKKTQSFMVRSLELHAFSREQFSSTKAFRE